MVPHIFLKRRDVSQICPFRSCGVLSLSIHPHSSYPYIYLLLPNPLNSYPFPSACLMPSGDYHLNTTCRGNSGTYLHILPVHPCVHQQQEHLSFKPPKNYFKLSSKRTLTAFTKNGLLIQIATSKSGATFAFETMKAISFPSTFTKLVLALYSTCSTFCSFFIAALLNGE